MAGEPRLKTRRKESRMKRLLTDARYAKDASVAETTALIRAFAAEQALINAETAPGYGLVRTFAVLSSIDRSVLSTISS
jgi:hypothetical protein